VAAAMTEAEVLGLFERCSNAGRWGENDELGTLNLITPERRLAAFRVVQAGAVVSLGKDLRTAGSQQGPPSALHVMSYVAHQPIGSADFIGIMPHGFEVTHLDAVAHSYFRGEIYNGRRATDVATPTGLAFGSVMAVREGIVTRGILLDVASARGIPYLASDEGVTVADLESAERLADVTVAPGDAVFVRTGHDLREAAEGWHGDAVREGVLPEVIPWLRDRDVAVYSGDCIEQLPSGYAELPLPLHQIGMVALGLAVLDIPDLEVLRTACQQHERSAFLLVVAPLRIPGGTASPVNPLAIF
jgi:kynurenine formamidase